MTPELEGKLKDAIHRIVKDGLSSYHISPREIEKFKYMSFDSRVGWLDRESISGTLSAVNIDISPMTLDDAGDVYEVVWQAGEVENIFSRFRWFRLGNGRVPLSEEEIEWIRNNQIDSNHPIFKYFVNLIDVVSL